MTLATFGNDPTYDQLILAVQSWSKGRSDIYAGDEGEKLADDFIRLTESDLNNDVEFRLREMESSATKTPDSSGQFTLPTDYLETRALVSTGSPRRNLTLIDPQMAEVEHGYRESDLPNSYTIIGDTVSILPVSTTDCIIYYYASIPALGWSNTTNWLLTKSPNTDLYGACLHAAIWLEDFEAEDRFRLRFLDAVQRLKDGDKGARWGRAPVRSQGQKP